MPLILVKVLIVALLNFSIPPSSFNNIRASLLTEYSRVPVLSIIDININYPDNLLNAKDKINILKNIYYNSE